MTNLTILKTSIRKLDGLYSLNDFHKASGAEEHLRPSKFIRNDQAKDLISEIEKDQSPKMGLACKSLRGGLNSSVWACEELALAYAMWISPKFHLVVLRAFIAMHKGEVKPQQNLPLVNPMKEIISREMPVEHWLHLASLWFHLYDYVDTLDKLKDPLEKLGSKYAPHVYSCATEDKITLGILKRILEPVLEGIEAPEYERHYRKALEFLRNYKPCGVGAIAVI